VAGRADRTPGTEPEPQQVEDDRDEERNGWKTEQGSQPLMKTGCRFLGKVDALNRLTLP
jgi:hypothetical protein